MNWDFILNMRFWVIAMLLLCVGVAFGLALSDNLPEVIDLTESQRQDIVAKQEKACGKETNALLKSFDEATDRCFERNRELIDALEDNTEIIQELDEDMNQAMYDLNQDLNKAIYDINCDWK